MKGVIICGGLGTRLKPLTDITNKSLLPVYDKPLILYPLQTLLDAGLTEIAIVSGPEHIDQMAGFLGSGARFGCRFTFMVQDEPKGIAHALGMAESFASGESVCAVLGDNIFFDADVALWIRRFHQGAYLFLKEVHDPERFGVAQLNDEYDIIGIEEKPRDPKSNYAITGLYCCDSRCFDITKSMKPSARGELEITDIWKEYLRQDGQIESFIMQDEWIDAGTFDSLLQASQLVSARRR